MGGSSAERKVSLSTGKQILQSLDKSKYSVYALDTLSGEAFLPQVVLQEAGVKQLTAGGSEITTLGGITQTGPGERPDVVFIALHGPGGEDGTVQGLLEVLGIPYTGSGVLASALAMDKAMSKRVLMAEGIKMPAGVVVRRSKPLSAQDLGIGSSLPLPVIVKPCRQGSTFGVTVVNNIDELDAALVAGFAYDDTVLVEQMVFGTEITVPILGNSELDVLPIVEIVPQSGFYDYEAKYTPGATDEIVPARISAALTAEANRIAVRCHEVLGCRGMSRTDMIVTAEGDIYTLEVNTIPGMTPTSLLPRAAEAAGIPFPVLLDRLIGYALES
jgi:D-alanine-D-alanine ligase